MLTALVHALILGLPLVQAPQKNAPSAEQVAEAEKALDAAFRSGDAKELQAALEAARSVPDADVVRRVARGLEDERLEVRLATLQALRWNEHPEAIQVLHKALKDRKRLKPVEYTAALLKAIGQHGDPGSVEALAHDPFEPQDHECMRARIFGLGRIRTRESLDALIGLFGISAPGARPGERRIQPWMEEMRLSLRVLTGTDQGQTPDPWERWWRDSKRTFEVPATIPALPKELREKWDVYWGVERTYTREGRREDRGGDPDQPRKE